MVDIGAAGFAALLRRAAKSLEDERSHAVAAIRADIADAQSVDPPSRADLHRLLDACLDLAPLAQTMHGEAQIAAREIGQVLVAAALGWTEKQQPNLAVDWPSLEADPELWRLEVVSRLHAAPTLLPERLRVQLVLAIAGLNTGDGIPPPFLAPSARDGRGKNPKSAREAEQTLCCWIAAQQGLGRKAGELTAEVAAAVGRSIKAVEAWKTEWISREGEAAVREELARYRDDHRFRAHMTAPSMLNALARVWLADRAPEKVTRD